LINARGTRITDALDRRPARARGDPRPAHYRRAATLARLHPLPRGPRGPDEFRETK